MSFQSKSPRVASQQLKVQELVIKHTEDQALYVVDGSDLILMVDEDVAQVKAVMHCDDSAAAVALVPAASVSVVDSAAYTAGGDRKAIKLASFTLAANDCLVLKYVLTE